MLDLIVLHQELICSILDAFDLFDIPRLPHDLSHLIDVPCAFLPDPHMPGHNVVFCTPW